jgi:DNA repair exonuclease SbcCD ATPase subunit
MEKVITLLKSLSAKVTAEGKKEAAQYDKFACFCKEQADEKLYSIEKSEAKIADLKAEIKELDTAIAELNSEISTLSTDISGWEKEIKDKTDKRNGEHDEYLVKAKDMNEAIDACGAAIDALKDSKSSMKGAKVDFAQVQKATGSLIAALSSKPVLTTAPGAVALVSKLSSEQAPKFEYQSNDIIATLDGLLKTFKKMKKNLDIQEHDINSAFESAVLGLNNQKKFAEQERAEKEAIVEGKTEKMNAAKDDKDEETKDKDADDAFMKEMTTKCEDTALLFDQRSKTRADELTALSDATAELEKGAVPNFGANKKLVGIQRKAVVKKAFIAISEASFVQISNVEHNKAGKEVVLKKVYDFLHGAAGRSGSTALASVSMRIMMAEDHFVKVRALIKDLISKLKADAQSEATQKGVCDKNMKKATSDRDSANSQLEVAQSKITTLTAKKNDLANSISTLQGQIAELQKALLEATELRNDEKAENEKTVDMSQEAIESVKLALSILQSFYNKAMLAQTGKYTPPNADRSGNTVGDLAPEVFDSKYKGSQSESKGIVGILEVILSDFERTNGDAKSDESKSKAEFEKFEKDTKEDVETKEGSIKKADGELSDAKSDILDQEKALSDAKDLLESSLKALEDLHAMCVAGEETYAERKKKREEEIEALKEAMTILDEWQKKD